MAVIYFIRHGETDWNVEGRTQGHLAVPLNANGRGQAARNGRMLRELLGDADGFDFVSSPLLRTRQTMEIIRREMGLPETEYRTDDRLKEIGRGNWQGYLRSELTAAFPEAARAYEADWWNFVTPGAGGESFAMLSQRVCEWFDAVERDTIVVSHGGPMRCIRRRLLGLDQDGALRLDAPQDKVMRILDGELTWY
jgi:broad specificity phosphatase PhoE